MLEWFDRGHGEHRLDPHASPRPQGSQAGTRPHPMMRQPVYAGLKHMLSAALRGGGAVQYADELEDLLTGALMSDFNLQAEDGSPRMVRFCVHQLTRL